MNSRGRIDLLDQFLLGLYVRTACPQRIKIFIRVDNNDLDTMCYIKSHEQETLKIPVTWIIEDQNYHMNQNLNLMALNFGQDINWCVNNDTCIMTHEWDLELDDFILSNNLLNKIAYIYINDDYSDPNSAHGCCFPILTNVTIQTMRCFFPNEIEAHGADNCLYKIFNTIKQNRIYHCPNLYIDHYCSYNNKYISDEINQHVLQLSRHTDIDKDAFNAYIKRLNRGIDEGY